MSEQGDLTRQPEPIFRDELRLIPQYPVFVPKEIKDSRLMEQRPKGDVLFVDSRDPGTATVIDTDTWQPELKHRKPVRLNLYKISSRRIAAIIYHTPPRSPENAYEEELANAASILRSNYETFEDNNKNSFNLHHLGALFVIEDKIKSREQEKNKTEEVPEGQQDSIRKWRYQSMNNIGLSMSFDYLEVNEQGENSIVEKSLLVIETDDFLITQGRVPKKHAEVNLHKGFLGEFIDRTIQQAVQSQREQGFEDTNITNLRDETYRSKMPLNTLSKVKHLGNTTSIDRMTGTSVERTNRGTTVVHRAPNDDYVKPNTAELRKSKKDPFAPLLVDPCPECKGQFHISLSEPWLYKGHVYRRETVICNGSHYDGYPKSRGKPRTVRVK